MDVDEHIAVLDREGRRLADVAASGEWDAAVPSCPGWTMRDVVTHAGGVHRWAADIVGRALPGPDPALSASVGTGPADGELVEWYRAGHAALVTTLRDADPDVACWSFLPAPSPLAFWARRQANEAAMHRVDVELAARHSPSSVEPDAAWDGVDELVSAFATRGHRVTADPPRTISVRPDTAPGWLVTIGPSGVTTTALRDGEAGDCTVLGRSHDLFLWAWHRPSSARISGDVGVLEDWARVSIQWS